MHAARATPQPGLEAPNVWENISKKAVDEDGAETAGDPATFCSHSTMLLRHRGGRNAIASAQMRIIIDLEQVRDG